jgi:uncharacterized OB-fold protein
MRESGNNETNDREQIPLVDFLALSPEPHLIAQQCVACGQRYFDHRDACANCFAADFTPVDIPNNGELVTFSIVSFARPGVPTPFVAAIVDCGGTWVRANLRDIVPDAEHVRLGMPVRLTTYSLGQDRSGTEAIGYAYRPLDPAEPVEEVQS